MGRQTVDLGFVVRRVMDDEFTMDTFEGRLRLQKTIYMLQACGAYMGYSFVWYLRGPYCPDLAAQGFELRHIYEEIPRGTPEFAHPSAQRAFKRFLKMVKGKTAGEMEILASLHLLQQDPGLGEDGAKRRVVNRVGCNFKPKQVSRMWDVLAKHGLVQ